MELPLHTEDNDASFNSVNYSIHTSYGVYLNKFMHASFIAYKSSVSHLLLPMYIALYIIQKLFIIQASCCSIKLRATRTR